MKENRTDSASNSQSSTPATGKQIPTSRLGRGLGSLIPAAPQQPFQPVALPATKPESDKSPSTASTPVKMPIALNVPLAIQSPLTNPTIQSIERSTGNIPVATQTIPGTAVVEMNISFIARNSTFIGWHRDSYCLCRCGLSLCFFCRRFVVPPT